MAAMSLGKRRRRVSGLRVVMVRGALRSLALKRSAMRCATRTSIPPLVSRPLPSAAGNRPWRIADSRAARMTSPRGSPPCMAARPCLASFASFPLRSGRPPAHRLILSTPALPTCRVRPWPQERSASVSPAAFASGVPRAPRRVAWRMSDSSAARRSGETKGRPGMGLVPWRLCSGVSSTTGSSRVVPRRS